MDIALFILRILIVIALYTFLGVLLWTLLRQQAPDHSTGLPRARLIQITVAYDLPWHMSERVYDLKASAWMGRDPNCLVQIDDDFASARRYVDHPLHQAYIRDHASQVIGERVIVQHEWGLGSTSP